MKSRHESGHPKKGGKCLLFMNSYFMNRLGVFSKIFEKKIKKEEIPQKEGNSHAWESFFFQ